MDKHINFVENVYTVVKKPFATLLGFYYNKNMNNSLDHFDVKKSICSLEQRENGERDEYEHEYDFTND